MPRPINTDSSEVKLSYQVYPENNSKPEDAILFNPELDQKFGQDILDDLTGKGLWDEHLEKQLENKQLYFKVFREDEDMIPVDAVMFENVRLLPNQGLLGLEESLQNKISNSCSWLGSFIPERVKQTAYDFGNSFAQWTEDKISGFSAYSGIPTVKEMDKEVWQEIMDENSDKSEIVDRIKQSGSDKTIKKDVGSVAPLLDPTYETIKKDEKCEADSTSRSFAESLLNTAWNFAYYAYNNPLKTFTLTLAAFSVANNFHLPKIKFENYSSPFTNGFSTATGILTKLAVAQVVTRGSSSTPINALVAGISLWSKTEATTLMSEFQVNTHTTQSQQYARVAVLKNGNFVVTWGSSYQDGSFDGIYGQLYNSTSNVRLGSEFQINTYTTDYQIYPSVASLSNGGFVVIWRSNVQDGSGYGIYGQRYNSLGITAGLEFRINTYTTGNQDFPTVLTLSDNNFVVMWTSDGQDGSLKGIYGQVFNNSGAQIGSEFRANTYTNADQQCHIEARLLNGDFIVMWTSQNQTGTDWSIQGQRFTSAGLKSGSEFPIINNTTVCVSMAGSLQNGNWLGFWQQANANDINGQMSLYGQLFNGTVDTKFGNEFRLNTYSPNDISFGDFASFSDNTFVVVWINNLQDGSASGIFAQQFDSTGNKIGTEFQVNIYTTGLQNQPAIASFQDGSFVVTWQSTDGDECGVYARIFTPPRLGNNTLALYRNQTRILTPSELGASAPNTNPSTLVFTLNNVTHGRFEIVTNPNISIFNFTQQQVNSGLIQFVHDGSKFAPAYNVKVKELVLDTSFVPTTIIFTNINYAPVLTGTGGSLTFIEKNPAIIIDSGIVASGVDSPNLTNATVVFTNSVLPNDVLSFTTQGGISGIYSNTTGTLLLTGSSSIFNYQSVLRSVTYFNPSFNPSGVLRTVSFTVNDGELDSNTISRSISVTPINDPPILAVNTLTITGGQALNLTATQLYAADPDTSDSSLTFTLSSIQFCRFERTTAAGISIVTFTQQDISNNQIRIVPTGGIVSPPAYQVSVSDGQYSTTPASASVNFNGGFVPSISVNKLTITQGGVVILTTNQLNAFDADTPASSLTFTASNIRYGIFSIVSNPANAITTFTLQSLSNGFIQFTQDGSENAPSYDISVSDGLQSTNTQAAVITYININQAPIVINVIPDRLSEKVNQAFSFQIAANTFFDSDPGDQQLLIYSARMEDGSVLPVWISFDSSIRQFTGKPITPGKKQISVIAKDPSNAMGMANFTIVTADSPSSASIPLLTIKDLSNIFTSLGSLAGGLATIALAYYRFVASHQKKHRYAVRVAEHLKLSPIYKMGSGSGIEFSEKMDKITTILKKAPEFKNIYKLENTNNKSEANKFEAVAKSIADAIQQTLETYEDADICCGAIKEKKLKVKDMTGEVNTPGETIHEIADKTLELYLRGRAIYLMTGLPGDLNAHKVSYIFVVKDPQNLDDVKLYYINHKAQEETLVLIMEAEDKKALFAVLNQGCDPAKPLQKTITKDETQWFWNKVQINKEHYEQVIDGIYQQELETSAFTSCCEPCPTPKTSFADNCCGFFQSRTPTVSTPGLSPNAIALNALPTQPVVPPQPSSAALVLPTSSPSTTQTEPLMQKQDSRVLDLSQPKPPTPESESTLVIDNAQGVGQAPMFRQS